MAQSVDTLLSPEVILREMSQVELPGTVLSDLFGWGLAARNPDAQEKGNMIESQTREGSIDIFNRSRKVATASVPGTPNTNKAPQAPKKFRYVIPRSAQMMMLTDEDLQQRRQLGQALNMVDQMGENWIFHQKSIHAQEVANLIEFQTAAMLRGTYTFDQVGDELRHGFSGGETTINFQIPAGNKNQLDMLGAGAIIGAPWSTTSTDIPGDVLAINNAMNALTGMGINHAVLNSNTWAYVIKNTNVINQGGSANTPFATYLQQGPGYFAIQLRAIPWVQWHVIDYTLDIWNGSAFATTSLIADDQVSFFPTPTARWTQYINGCEPITEGPNGTRQLRYGYYQFGYQTWNPSGWNICTHHNGIPGLMNPNAIVCADVTP